MKYIKVRKETDPESTKLAEDLIDRIRRREPVLRDPDGLTDNIMAMLGDKKTARLTTSDRQRGKAIIIIQRLLAAASVCLLLVFGYEEYVLVDKISRLEKQNASIAQFSQYEVALKLNKAVSILSSKPELLSQFKEFKTGKMNFLALFRAAMYADAAGINYEILQSPEWKDIKAENPSIISIFKQFDSSNNKIRR
jgi:hypothetical protein